MKEIIVAGVFTLLGALINSLLDYIKVKKEDLSKEQLRISEKLCNQLFIYQDLEVYYVTEIIKLRKESKKKEYKEKGIKDEFRRKVYRSYDDRLLSRTKLEEYAEKFSI